ncbi:MAG: hypothetical protein GOV15_03705, partial [Candidatus Diapherotrites archaeon]|nr:hypothetical protein [Candidatus Diapherotrites archaeon]
MAENNITISREEHTRLRRFERDHRVAQRNIKRAETALEEKERALRKAEANLAQLKQIVDENVLIRKEDYERLIPSEEHVRLPLARADQLQSTEGEHKIMDSHLRRVRRFLARKEVVLRGFGNEYADVADILLRTQNGLERLRTGTSSKGKEHLAE